MIESLGEHPNPAAKLIQVIDPTVCQTIVDTFNAAASQPDFAGMLIDREHFQHDLTKPTESYGWLMSLQSRADGIFGQIRWTSLGQAPIGGGPGSRKSKLVARNPSQTDRVAQLQCSWFSPRMNRSNPYEINLQLNRSGLDMRFCFDYCKRRDVRWPVPPRAHPNF